MTAGLLALLLVQPGVFPHAAVVSNDPIASLVGAEVMRSGGNAVDAAVAVGFALAVTWPEAGNIGGGGFMVVRMADGRAYAYDFREVAPLRAHPRMYLDETGEPVPELSTAGHLSVGVPGTVAGFEMAHRALGLKPWKDLVQPSVALAEDGFQVSELLLRSVRASRALLRRFPESRRIFVDGLASLEPGAVWKQPELARTLSRIRDSGAAGFYTGETAGAIAAEMAANGGMVGAQDLASYSPVRRSPVRGTYRGREIITMPPPSSGGVALIQMLAMLEPFDLRTYPHNGIQHSHLMAEVMKRAFADRAKYMADPAFAEIPMRRLLSRAYLRERMATFTESQASKASDWGDISPPPEGNSTTHYSIVDRHGNAVAVTYTLNSSYGSGVTVPGAGILLNNEMDDFTVKAGVPNIYGLIQSEINLPEPGKRPLSSMTPTIVALNGRPFLVTGSPGGPRIINAVLQSILNVVDFGMTPQEAVDAPRLHHQWLPDQLVFEPGQRGYRLTVLRSRGHAIGSGSIGNVQMIIVDPATGHRFAASDPRRQQGVAGY